MDKQVCAPQYLYLINYKLHMRRPGSLSTAAAGSTHSPATCCTHDRDAGPTHGSTRDAGNDKMVGALLPTMKHQENGLRHEGLKHLMNRAGELYCTYAINDG